MATRGIRDHTNLPVTITGSTASVDVNLASSDIVLDVNIDSITAPIDVNIDSTTAPIDVNIDSITAPIDVNIDSTTAPIETIEVAGTSVIGGSLTATGAIEAVTASVAVIKSVLLRCPRTNVGDFDLYDSTGATMVGYLEPGEAIELPVSPASVIRVQGTIGEVIYWIAVT